MTVNPATMIFDQTMQGMLRVRGSLAAGTALAQGSSYRERMRMPASAASIDVRVKMAVTGGTPTVQLVPQTADKMANDLTVSDATSGLTAATNITNNTEVTQQYIPKGEMFIDVVIDCNGGSAAGTLTYVDVGVKRQ